MAFSEAAAVNIFQAAITEGRAGELLEALFDGAGVTLDAISHRIVIIPAAQLAMFSEKQ